jgi:hypothetical protein
MRDSALMDLTEAQQAALDHARDLLAGDGGTEQVLGNPDWHRACRIALRDILGAFGENPHPVKGGG